MRVIGQRLFCFFGLWLCLCKWAVVVFVILISDYSCFGGL